MGSSLFEYHRINQLQVWPLNENRHPHLTWCKNSVIFSSELLAVRSFDMGVLQSTNNKSSLLPVPSLVFSERKNLASSGAFVFHGTASFKPSIKLTVLDKADWEKKLSSKQQVVRSPACTMQLPFQLPWKKKISLKSCWKKHTNVFSRNTIFNLFKNWKKKGTF